MLGSYKQYKIVIHIFDVILITELNSFPCKFMCCVNIVHIACGVILNAHKAFLNDKP